MEFNVNDIKTLREITGAGILDCKKALIECDGDMQAAADYLRKKGLAAANKRAGREIKEGTILVRISGDNRKA
ncbi:MAG TPA: elongation factor Ts, partial [Spirochaetales bacterium]|nr:elongation factor Ts [Spirochaetales bacterium]